MANDRVRGNDIGPTGVTVGTNIARLRRSRQVSLKDLEDKLVGLGRRISLSGLSKIERGERRADVDDLMALALALDVSPLALLLPIADEPGADVEVTGATGSVGLFWTWALAERTPFSRDDRSFVARSLPWWLEAHTDMTWYGNLSLSVGLGGATPEIVETHFYTAKTPADAHWDRLPDGVDEAAFQTMLARGKAEFIAHDPGRISEPESADGVDQAAP